AKKLRAKATIGAVLLALGPTALSDALSEHLRTSASEPQVYAYLQRLQLWCGEFRHAITNVEGGTMERCRHAIAGAVGAAAQSGSDVRAAAARRRTSS
ncbi:MAG: hypothetical protein ACLQF4_09910, partial [Xanthobacteraceae bacterium]